MGIKRIVDTCFWNDDKVMDVFNIEDKLFMLYLMTNPHTTQLGVYKINIKQVAFEIGYSIEKVKILLEKFEKEYQMIKYSSQTKEIAIKNYLRYSIIKGGKPVEDCLKKEINQVKNKNLLGYIKNNLIKYSDLNETVFKIINNLNYNDNDNDNDNEVSYHDTYHDTYYDTYYDTSMDIFSYVESNFKRTLSPIEIDKISQWSLLFNIDIIKYAIELSVLNGKKTFNYVEGILKNWQGCNYKTIEDIKNNEQKENNKEIKPNWYGKDVKKKEMSKEEQEELEKLLNEFKGD